MSKQISEQRKAFYYAGTGLMIVGGLFFASCLFSFARNYGAINDFDAFDRNARSSFFRAFGGMGLIVVGGFIKGIGARGLAGSGVVLDPDRARRDLEPYSRMVGGMAKDALDEADVHLGGGAQRVVMVKCLGCGTLNEDGSKFCQECGQSL